MKEYKKIEIILALILAVLILVAIALYWKMSKEPEMVTKNAIEKILKATQTTDGENNYEEKLAELFMTDIQKTQLACALDSPEKHQQTFYEEAKSGFAKVEYDVSVISQKKNTAKVKVTMNYFELQKIVKNAQEKVSEDLQDGTPESMDMLNEEVYKAIAEEFQKGPKSGSKKSITVVLHRKNHKWNMEDNFENRIFENILQQ